MNAVDQEAGAAKRAPVHTGVESTSRDVCAHPKFGRLTHGLAGVASVEEVGNVTKDSLHKALLLLPSA